MKDIFPHLSDLAILNALKECGDVENAVSKLLEKTAGSVDQISSYASIIGNNDDWDSDEVMESVWRVSSDETTNANNKTEEQKQVLPIGH